MKSFGSTAWSQPADPAAGAGANQTPPATLEAPPLVPTVITLEPGEIRSLTIGEEITRVAVGDPGIVDITILSSNELLLQAMSTGTTTLILWDQQGQHRSQIQVIDKGAEEELIRILSNMDLKGVRLRREDQQLFVTGEVTGQEAFDRLQQVLRPYGNRVTNLVKVLPGPPPPPPPLGKSVTLTIQLIELSRDATDEFGVDWANTVTFTETTFGTPALTEPRLERISDAFRIGAFSRSTLSPTLSALVKKGKARILAEPKLVAASGKEASALLGLEVPIVTAVTTVATGLTTQTIEFKKTGVEMKFTPFILQDERSITLNIDIKVSSIDRTNQIEVGGAKIPGFRVRQTKTEFLTQSGEGLVIAGLLQDEEKKNLEQVPGIGSVPVLGNLFRINTYSDVQTELVMMVTPEIVGDAAEVAEHTMALEQALSVAEVSGAVQDPMMRYVLQIQDRVAKALRFPQREKEVGMSGRVKLRLHVFRDGTLGRAVVSESSGIESFDTEALKAAEAQAPYPPFPSELTQQEIWLELPVVFRL